MNNRVAGNIAAIMLKDAEGNCIIVQTFGETIKVIISFSGFKASSKEKSKQLLRNRGTLRP